MYAQKKHNQSILRSKQAFYLYMLVLGLLSGWSNITWLHQLCAVIAEIFIKLFQCMSLPVISLSIIVTLANYKTEAMMSTNWYKVISYTFSTTLIAATISCLLYILIHPALPASAQHITSQLPTNNFNYLAHISNLIPQTLLSPFLQQQVIAVLFLSIIFGLAIRNIADDTTQQYMRQLFQGLHSMLIVVIHWIVLIIPIAMFSFISVTVQQLHTGIALQGIGYYLLVIVLANLIQGLIVLPLWLKLKGLQPFKIMQAMLPALSLAFFSKSSVGTLPVTMKTAEANLNINPQLSRFMFPLCTSLNMNGCAAFIFTTVIYLMQNDGIIVSYSMMGLWIAIATIAAIGNAGVPMGCFFLSASLLSGMHVSITLMGIILPFYGLIDMLETALNVWSDTCVISVVNYNSNG